MAKIQMLSSKCSSSVHKIFFHQSYNNIPVRISKIPCVTEKNSHNCTSKSIFAACYHIRHMSNSKPQFYRS